VYANKQDVRGAMTAAEISQQLGLTRIKDHGWHIQACCALTGEGYVSAVLWLVSRWSQKALVAFLDIEKCDTNIASCATGDTVCPACYAPDAAAQLQPIPYACSAQRAFLPLAVDPMNIHDVRDRRQTDDRRRQTRIIA